MLFDTTTKVKSEDFKSKILDMLTPAEYKYQVNVGVLTSDNLDTIKKVELVELNAKHVEKYSRMSMSINNHTEIDLTTQLLSVAVHSMETELFTQIQGRATQCTDINDMLAKCTDDQFIAVVPFGTAIQLDNFGRCGGVPVYFANVTKAVMYKPSETYFAVNPMSFIRNLPDEDLIQHVDAYQMYVEYVIGCFGDCYTVQ